MSHTILLTCYDCVSSDSHLLQTPRNCENTIRVFDHFLTEVLFSRDELNCDMNHLSCAAVSIGMAVCLEGSVSLIHVFGSVP